MTIGTGNAISSPRKRARATLRSAGSAGISAIVLLVALAAQMALPALHAWRSGETASASPAAALASRSAAETAGPAFSHAAPVAGTHDPATCAVCQLLHNASRAAPTPASFAWALVAGDALLTAPTPRTPDRAAQGNHPPRAPPVQAPSVHPLSV